MLAVAAAPALGWGHNGHRITALIAEQFLQGDAKTLAQVKAIMGSEALPDSATYPDVHKGALDKGAPYAGSREWHYDDRPVCGPVQKYAPGVKWCPKGACVSGHLNEQIAAMKAGTTPFAKQMGVRFTVHFLGDIHQPLHTANNNDRGGGELPASYQGHELGGSLHLHGYWDDDLVEDAMKAASASEDPAVQESDLATALHKEFAAKYAEWTKGTVEDWIEESHKLARDLAYGAIPGFSCGAPIKEARLSDAYVKQAHARAREQLAKAGARIAFILKREFGK